MEKREKEMNWNENEIIKIEEYKIEIINMKKKSI